MHSTYIRLFFVAICCLNFISISRAQTGYGLKKLSATEYGEEHLAFMAGHREQIAIFSDSLTHAIIEIPIKVHIIRKDDASTVITVAEIQAAIKHLNEQFLPIYIRFIPLPDYNYINSTYFHTFEKTKEAELADKNDTEKAINLYIVGNIKIDKNNYNAYTHPPSNRPKDRIFITNKAILDKTTLLRQIGHYFSLYPTHGTHATERTAELADGSNCKTTGDEICDTPADPRLDGRMVDGRCTYIGNIQDGNNKFYRPQIENFMSDNPRISCVTVFTKQQYARMLYTAINIRNYLTFPKSSLSAKQRKAVEEAYGIAAQIDLLIDGNTAGTNLVRNLYTVSRKQTAGSDIKININNSRKCYIYVLEGDNARGTHLIYPQKNDKLYFEDKNFKFGVPSNDGSISIDNGGAGSNYIAILFSKKQLNIQDLLKKINEVPNTKFDMLQRIYYVLGEDLVPTHDLLYDVKGLVKVSGITSERVIIPIFIEYVQE